MTSILDGRKLAQQKLDSLKLRVQTLKEKGVNPKLLIVGIGDDRLFGAYVRQKLAKAQEVGIDAKLVNLKADAKTAKIEKAIIKLEREEKPHGLIVQLPLPDRLDKNRIINAILPDLDVDGLTAINFGKLAYDLPTAFRPPTIKAILTLLAEARVDYQRDYFVLVGTGQLVGRPLANILARKQATFSALSKNTANLADFTTKADVLVSGVGKTNLIKADMVKASAVVIDAGFSLADQKPQGDVDFEKITKTGRVRAITPTPGGVGPLTVAFLLENTIDAAARSAKK